MAGQFEARLRDRLSSGSSIATAIAAFNDAMNTHLHIRHKISLNPDSRYHKAVYPVSFDASMGAIQKTCARTGSSSSGRIWR
eukprot:973487-Prymnesium_polylepis.1